MATFLVTEQRSGPEWLPGRPLEEQSGWQAHAVCMDALVAQGLIILGGPLADEHRVVLVFEAESPEAVRAALEPDPWIPSHLRIESIELWSIRLNARAR